MDAFTLTSTCRLVLEEGNIVTTAADVLVNAANRRMLGGGGVDGAIHAAAGPELKAACEAVAEVEPGIRCPTGEARITPGFGLECKHIIHTVGPVYHSDERSAPLLVSAYKASLALANEHGAQTIAFPAISCGVFHYPVEDAAQLALLTCRDHAGGLRGIRFVLFGEKDYGRWLAVARTHLAPEVRS